MNYYGNGNIQVSPRWSIRIGKITVQRKWWDGWRITANMLQFKIDPTEMMDDQIKIDPSPAEANKGYMANANL